jgi:hypothetical protein
MAQITSLDQQREGRGGSPSGDTARLQVILTRDSMSSLRALAARKGITVSEAIRRAISLWEFTEEQIEHGAQLAMIEEDNGQTKVREIVLLG